MSSAKRSKGRLLLLLFFYLKTISFSSRQPNTLHDVLQSLSRIPGRVKFSTAKVPEALWMQSMSVQMDRLESQTLHRFLCSKNSQDFIRTHQSGPGLETKRARRRGNGASLDTRPLPPRARWLVVGHWPAGTSPGAPAAAGPSFGLGVAAFQPNWATPSPLTTVRQQVLPPGVVPQLSVDMFRSIGFALRSF